MRSLCQLPPRPEGIAPWTHLRALTFNDNPTEAAEHEKQALLEHHILVAMRASAFSEQCGADAGVSRWMVRFHAGSGRMDGLRRMEQH